MKKYKASANIRRILVILLLYLSLVSCDRNRNNPGWDYFPDMFYSTAYETYSGNKAFNNRMTMRVPVTGTVPRNVFPFHYTIEAESRKLAGEELKNPVSPTPEALLRGIAAYEIFCTGCHGHTGDGNGHMVTTGVYPMKPRLLTGEIAENLRDGEIFHTIYMGFGSMGPHGSQMKTDDIWKVVHYVRKLQEEAR
jgi:hypothetical protein